MFRTARFDATPIRGARLPLAGDIATKPNGSNVCAIRECVALPVEGSRYCSVHKWRERVEKVVGPYA